jgi:hypothetical protein
LDAEKQLLSRLLEEAKKDGGFAESWEQLFEKDIQVVNLLLEG